MNISHSFIQKIVIRLVVTVLLLVVCLVPTLKVVALTSYDAYCIRDADCPVYDPNACSTDTGDTSESSTNLSGNGNAQKIFNYFVNTRHLQPFQAAGILGNIAIESAGTFDPTIVQGGGHSNDPSSLTSTSQGYGIVQFTPGKKLIDIISGASISGAPNQLATQLDALWAQLSGTAGSYSEKAAGDSIQASTDVQGATKAFMLDYERPLDQSDANLNPRTAAARGFLTKFGGASSSSDLSDGSVDSSTSSTSACCPPTASGSGNAGPTESSSPSDWVKMYTGANAAKVNKMAHGDLVNPSVLAIHYTVGNQEGQDLLDFFANSSEGTGIQFNVGKTGKIYQYYPLDNMKKTWHVGNANSKAIGIEITGKDVNDLLGNDAQFNAVVSLATFLCDKYSIPCSQPKGDITGDGVATAQGMLGHDEIPSNDHVDPDATAAQAASGGLDRRDSSKHPYMIKLRTAMGFEPTPGSSTQPTDASGTDTDPGPTNNASCSSDGTSADSATGNGTAANPVGDGLNRALALEAVRYDTKANNGKYTYVWGGLHGAVSDLQDFADNGGGTDCSGFVRYIIWRVYGQDIGAFVTQSVPTMASVFKEVPPDQVAAGDIGWREDHVDFITQNNGGGKLHQFGAHSEATDLYGGDTDASGYTKFFRYIGPKSGAGD